MADGKTHCLSLATLGSFNLKLDGVTTIVTTNDLGVELEFDSLLC